MRSPGDAARAILEGLAPLPVEQLPLLDALGRVLAEDVRSPLDLPPWDNSAMDGYAVRGVDLEPGRGPWSLRIVEEIPAGGFPSHTLGAGECARIFTGAPIPAGADGVIRQEDTDGASAGAVRILDSRDRGRNLRRRGEDLTQGALALARGTALGPAELGVLASIAQPTVAVHRTPTVALLGSGNEIADLDERAAILAGTKIASSNTYTLIANIRRAGATALNLGVARDDPEDLRRRLTRAAPADLLVTTAGISVGEHDYLRTVFEEMGGKLGFWRIRMRPGAPVGFGTLHGRPWIGLPGNPVSTMVTFELFVRPAIRRLQGHALPFRRSVPVEVTEPLHYPARLTHFLRVIVVEEEGHLRARLTGPQGSGILTSMARANALLIVPADRDQVAAGEHLRALLLDEPVHVAAPEFE
ncbi:MAG: molybdopterin molybdotransferase MoeA [Gemmatimonadota bacterium]|nr:molybdopterin molybdotransferase MoeA [Gemmatimonadota bacterium]MDH5196466.1 molybdopterin molybdotransferase MoeA [Gemmatimonadota bacterium]